MARVLNLRGVHVYKKVPGKQATTLSEVHPAVGFNSEAGTFWLQDGTFYTGDNKPVKDVPAWVLEAVERTDPKVLAAAGYVKPAKKAA